MPTIEQIKAARALIGWSQKDLSDYTGLSTTGIARIENGNNQPNSTTIEKIINAFDNADIEFIDESGVKKRANEISTLKGVEGFAKFRKEVLIEASKNNPDICISNLDERQFDKWGDGEINNHYRGEMAKIREKCSDLKFRSLAKKGDTHFSAAKHSEYRWVGSKDFGDFPFYIFGNKTAMLMFEEDDIHIFIINHPVITAFYRAQFNKWWDNAEIIDSSKLRKLQD